MQQAHGLSIDRYRIGGSDMWMSDCLIVVDQKNEDLNTITDLAAAVGEVGTIRNVDRDEHVILATVPSHEIPVVTRMAGVSYVRCVFSYYCGQPPRRAA